MINLKNISNLYNISTDYSLLKELVVNGYQIPCFVKSATSDTHSIFICKNTTKNIVFVSTGVTALIIWHYKLYEFENYCRKFEVCFIQPDNTTAKIESNNLQTLTTRL